MGNRIVQLLEGVRAGTIAIGESIGTGQGALVVDSNHVFADAAARDTYFDTPDPHLDELEENQTYIIVGSGFQLWQGTTNPSTYDNSNWLDVTGLIRGPQGNPGTNGSDGNDGADGRTILNGTIDPDVGTGVNGDFYINTATSTIFGPKAGGVWPAGVPLIGPTGNDGESGEFPDVTFTNALTLNPANLSTYNRHNVIYTGTAIQTVTLDSIANFIADPETNIIYRIINESASPLNVTAAVNETFGNTNNQTIALNRGQSITVKVPTSGTRWDLLAGQTNIGGGTTPLRPDPTPITGDVILQATPWDASSGSFPSGTISSGFLYTISSAGTVDNEDFFVDDLLLAVTDNPSTSVFASNWHRIDGDEYVHSWGGLNGVIDDDDIRRVLTRLGFTSSTTFAAPSAHNFSININSRVDVGTDLNVQHTVTYSVTNRQNISTTQLIVTPGDNTTLTNATRDGIQTQNVTVTGTDTSSATTITFLVRLTDTQNNTHDSNTVTITVADPITHEQTHFGTILSTEDETDIVFANDDIEARDAFAGTWTVSGIPADSNLYRLYWAVPTADGSITRVSQGGFTLYEDGLSSGNQFTELSNITIGGQTYNVLLMVAASAVNNNYNGTTLTVS